jgi:hypothetical protein
MIGIDDAESIGIEPMKLSTSTAVVVLTLFCFPVCASADTFGSGVNQFTIDFVTIGDPGNPADTTGNPNPAGSVEYPYRIATDGISGDIFTKANIAGGLGVFIGNISDRPISVQWSHAARFVNWLNTSQGYPPAYKFSHQPGEAGYNHFELNLLWQAGEPGFDPGNPFRNTRAHYFLPTADEWYKAAFYDSNLNGGAGGYWDLSYGVIGMTGNHHEWEEGEFDLVNDGSSPFRTIRSRFCDCDGYFLASERRPMSDFFFIEIGFRVASKVPEPSTALIGALVALVLSMCRMRVG